MGLYKKYTNLRRINGQMSMMGIVSTSADVPKNPLVGSVVLVQDTQSFLVYTGAEWNMLAPLVSLDYVDVSIPPKCTKEELDYMNNVKPFLDFLEGKVVLFG